MHAAVYDTINSAWWTKRNATGTGFRNYLTLWLVDPAVDDDLAAGLTARDLLLDLFPAHSALINQTFTARHGAGTPQAAARRLADLVVNGYRSNRANDGSTPNPGYTPDGVPGAWRPTGHLCPAALDPHWGGVKPFALTSGSQFRRPLPGGYTTYSALLNSSLYASNVAEVRSLGRSNSTTRTPAQTTIAWFWANDLDGTYKPPGQLLDHTRTVVQPRITDPVRVSRAFALVAMALADAGIAAWDQKYRTTIDLWRPETAIQQHATNPDPSWRPLSADRNNVSFSPCFPAWVSGHATFAGAWGAVMKRVVGDVVSFAVGTEDPHLPAGTFKAYTSINQAAVENARSRIYLGVHYQFDADDGLASGNSVGQFVYTNKLTTLVCNLPCG
jgi:membrane-associated phospholipid phosphatase